MKKTLIVAALILGFNNSFGQRDFSPKFSNDGEKIAFYSYRNGEEPEIFIIDTDGNNLNQLTETDGNWAIEPRWSPDDNSIGYSMGENMGQLKLRVTALKNKEGHFITQNKGLQFISCWTTNGIVYGAKEKSGFKFFIHNQVKKTDTPIIINEFENYFLMSSVDNTYYILSVKDEGKKGLWLLDKKGISKHLTELDGKNIAFSKDNKYIVFESIQNDNTDIYSINLDGTDLKRLTEHEAHDYMPSIDFKGEHIVFSSGRSGDFYLYKMNLRSGDIIQLTGL
jgi:Tol biopolymer transport system component